MRRARMLFSFDLPSVCPSLSYKIIMYSRNWFKNLPLSTGTALVDAWAASLAAEVLERSGLPLPDGTPHSHTQREKDAEEGRQNRDRNLNLNLRLAPALPAYRLPARLHLQVSRTWPA